MNSSTEGQETAPVVQIAQKFEHFLEVYRRSDGSRWGGQDLDGAAGGGVRAERRQDRRVHDPGRTALLVEWMGGDYANVVGLPLALTSRMLAGFGIEPYY